MKRVAIVLFAVANWQLIYGAQTEHSTSPSRQFIVFGADSVLRGAVSDAAERAKTDLLALLRQRDNWTVPIVLNLQPQQANLPELAAAELRFSQTGFGLKLQLDVTFSQDLDVSLVERELLRAILLEMIYRKRPQLAAGTTFIEPPDWLIDGTLALAPGHDRGQLVEALTATENTPTLEKFLQQRPAMLDSAGRVLYRAYSLALVQMLLEPKDGAARLAQYIGRLSDASNDPLTDLKAQFPFLRSDAEETWQSRLHQLRNFQAYQLLTFAESERLLGELLQVKASEANRPPKLTSVAELAKRKPSANEKMALNDLSHELLVFVVQANPVLRPIAREYGEIAALLVRGKRRGIVKRLSRLETTHKQLASRMSDIDDYMNWFEATQMKNGSGNFTDYLKAIDQSQLSISKRRDPLTVYVDALEDQLEN